MGVLFNRVERKKLIEMVRQEPFRRKIVSFYRYAPIEDPQTLRDELYKSWLELKVLGRIYVAREGMNAQMSVPEMNWEKFLETLSTYPFFKDIFINHASTESSYAFFKLDVRAREKIVVHRLREDPFHNSTPGKHLSPQEFHEMANDKNAIVVDARNSYECDIGHFENAFLPTSKTFSKILPELKEKLAPYKDKKIMMYCTGGIRCEIASAYLKKEGFQEIYQLQGGIIHYINEMQNSSTPSKYKGSVYVFDERMAEATNREKMGKCYQCDAAHSAHSNCGYIRCHGLIIQCPSCAEKYQNCCSVECIEKRNLL